MRRLAKRLAHRVRGFLLDPLLNRRSWSPAYPDAAAQLQLKLTYQAMRDAGRVMPTLDDVGFKVLSQADEDGILLFLFALLGSPTKRVVELCAGNGIECNAANLILHHGWWGLLVDGDESLVAQGREFYRKSPHTYVYPPAFACEWLTRDNVNEVLRAHGAEGEIDLLSIDLDGMDYWIWNAIDVVTPRVVVVEYQDILGPERCVTVPYSDHFNARAYPTTRGMPNYCGASLAAMVKLGRAKGYRLVGCNRYGYNAFFVRHDLAAQELPEVAVRACFRHPKTHWGMAERFETVKDLPWVEV